MAPPLQVRLDRAAHDELERRYHTTRDATTRTRYQMILLRAEGHRVPEDPHQVGVDSALWSCRLLSDYLAGVTGYRAGIESVRIALHRAGFVCKRPRWVLTRKAQAQPGWATN